MIRRFVLSAGLAVAALLAMTAGGVVHAQGTTPGAGNGMRVAPVRSDLTIKPGASQTVDVYVTNVTGSKAKLKAIVNDFTASDDESGKPRILLDENSQAPSHGLKQYIDKIEPIDIGPNEQKIVKVRIAIPSSAAGGGYFGAVRFMPTSVDESKNVSLSASVGTLFLVTVPGDVKEQASVESLNVARGEGKASNMFTNGTNLHVAVRVRNSGNVQVSPFGKVSLKKGGKNLADYEINNTNPRGSVLPDSVRRFQVDFGDKAKTIGKYSVVANLGYGEKGQLITSSTSFWVLPLPIIITLAVCLVLIIIAIFTLPRMMKSHDRRLLRKVRRNG